jgi:tetratricopeptide (TPR) repeat protein
VWRYALAKLLITDLAQSRYVNILSTDQLHSVLKELNLTEAKNYTTEHLLEIGKRARVNHVLTSSFIKMGDNFAITAELKNLETNEVLHAFKLTAKNENDIFPMVDDLTRKIKVKLNLSEKQLSEDIDQSIIDVTTSSPEALKHFIEGERLRLNLKYTKAIESLKRAVNLDPEFAMAYELLRNSYWHMNSLKSNYYGQRAVELKDRLPLNERYQIEASYLWDQDQDDLAIEKLNHLLNLYPDHVNARKTLGVIYNSLGEYDKAIEQINQIKNKHPQHYYLLNVYNSNKGDYEKVRQIEEENFSKFKNIRNYSLRTASSYLMEGEFELARKMYGQYFNTFKIEDQRKEQFNWYMGNLEFYRGNLEEAQQMFSELEALKEFSEGSIIFMAAIHLVKGKVGKAILEYEKCYQMYDKPKKGYNDRDRIGNLFRFLSLKGLLAIRIKKYQEALTYFEKANRLVSANPGWSKSKWLGLKSNHLASVVLAYTEMGALDKAEALLKELRATIPDILITTFPRTGTRLRDLFLRGRIALVRKDLANAIKYLKLAESILIAGEQTDWRYSMRHPIVLYYLANAYHLNENIPQAIETYEKINLLTVQRVYYGDIYTKSFYSLGKLYQQQGSNEKALENYKKFIQLFKDCDHIFQPLVEDAKKREKECRDRF